MNYFLTGTDTGVGKTYVASLLVRAGRKAGLDTVGMKPICAGDRDDAGAIHQACDEIIPINTINPVWYRTPAAPYTAAMVENRPVDLALIRETYRQLRSAHRSLIVEGVGGWLVPIERDYFVADLAAEMELPVVVVVRNRLGAINQTLLTVRDIERRGLPFAGYIFNEADPVEDVAGATNREILSDLLGQPPLWTVPQGAQELILPTPTLS